MKNDDESGTEWSFQIEGEEKKTTEKKEPVDGTWVFKVDVSGSSIENKSASPANAVAKSKETPLANNKNAVEKKIHSKEKAVIDPAAIDGEVRLQLDRRPSKLRKEVEGQLSLQKETIKNMRAVEDKIIRAPLLKRMIAQVVDIFVVFLLFVSSAYIAPYAVKGITIILEHANSLNYFDSTATSQLTHLVIFVFAVVFVFVFMLSATNTTFGKNIMGLQVRDIDRPGISLPQAFLREIILKPLSLLSVLGILYSLINEDRRTLHDVLSSTIVTLKK